MALLFSFVAGCGVAGSPIAPEDIGIEAKIRAQRQAEEQTSPPEEPCREGPEPALPALPVLPVLSGAEGSGVEGSEANGCPPWLPPLQPVGTQ